MNTAAIFGSLLSNWPSSLYFLIPEGVWVEEQRLLHAVVYTPTGLYSQSHKPLLKLRAKCHLLSISLSSYLRKKYKQCLLWIRYSLPKSSDTCVLRGNLFTLSWAFPSPLIWHMVRYWCKSLSELFLFFLAFISALCFTFKWNERGGKKLLYCCGVARNASLFLIFIRLVVI